MGDDKIQEKGPSDVPSTAHLLLPETDLSHGIVGWEGQSDPRHPRNFSPAAKWIFMSLVSCMIVLSFLASSIVAPAAPHIDTELHNDSDILSSLVTTIYVLGFMVGPLILSPLSEVYGRLAIIHPANAFFTATHIGVALAPGIGRLLAFRALSGLGASACLSIGGGLTADLFDIHDRGLATALLTLGSLFGPVFGPIFGGIITQRAGWRWNFWVMAIACAAVSLTMAVFARETHAEVIIRRKTLGLQKSLRSPGLQSAYEAGKGRKAPKTAKAQLSQGLVRPWQMLLRSPLLPITCLPVGFISGLLYILLTTTSEFFQEVYGWSLEAAGLAYLGLGGGSAIGFVFFATTSDLITVRLTKKNSNTYTPEMRLVTSFLPALFIPISFFWYGWSTYEGNHWIVPILSLAPFGFAQFGMNASFQAYMVDASGAYAASAMACVSSVRCLFGAFVPLAGPSLYANLGLNWGNSLLGFVSLAMVPLPVLMYRFGQRLREIHPLDTP
ncbi:mfs multidrug transporter [Diplodia corticola]|uniref:Mfs multidrug transporter n=1 Tax=Diplodia corticola TaxID=236234 RepID=A0A1J9QNJ7_9PEZI|nr:mfs multidrug transporter [Diplodia corticola]OJD30032.1 mfs multidrug transporter [Diplodia corticola]